MSIKIFKSPPKYVQGPDALQTLGDHLQAIGISNPIIMASPSAMKACKEIIETSLKSKNMTCSFTKFSRVCSANEINRVKDLCLSGNHDAIIACGGGAAIDAGRAAAAGAGYTINPFVVHEKFGANVPYIQIPTVAASDASTAALSVIYTDKGNWADVLIIPNNPNLVLADTRIIAQAPVRTLVAGMGDALATYFEADACHRTATLSFAGGLATQTALQISRLSYDILTTYGTQAVLEAEANIPGPALEAVVEANILLSGLGYENAGLAAAHALATAFSHQYELFDPVPFHGELVAFCTAVQLIMEEAEPEKLQEVYFFCQAVGLPTSFEELGLKDTSDGTLKTVAEEAAKSLTMMAMPKAKAVADAQGFVYDVDEILNAIKLADQYSQLETGQCHCADH
jgi:glycerol dehydrogenase